MKKCFFQIVLFIILFFNFTLWAQGNLETKNEIIGTVNGENLYLNEFNRLFNAQNKKYEKESAREIILDQMIDKILVMQEAKSRSLNVSEAEINRRLDLIKERQGGEEAFANFLTQNNATIEDAKNEIKNQILFDFLKNSIESKDGKSFKSFISAKKINSDIVIFTSKINPQKDKAANLRTKEYPTITKSRVKEVEQLDEETKSIIAEIESGITKDNDVPLLNEEQIKALNSKTKHPSSFVIIEESKPSTELPNSQQNQVAIDINKVTEPLILDPIKPIEATKTTSLLKEQLTLNPINPLKNEPVVIASTSTESIEIVNKNEVTDDLELVPNQEIEIGEIIISDELTIGNTSLIDDSNLNNKSEQLKELIRKIEERKLSSR